jgi:hypothetical protein
MCEPTIVNHVKLKLKIFGSHQVHFDDNICQGLVIIVICLYNEQLCLTHLSSYGSPPTPKIHTFQVSMMVCTAGTPYTFCRTSNNGIATVIRTTHNTNSSLLTVCAIFPQDCRLLHSPKWHNMYWSIIHNCITFCRQLPNASCSCHL